jgi:hypothetical protein
VEIEDLKIVWSSLERDRKNQVHRGERAKSPPCACFSSYIFEYLVLVIIKYTKNKDKEKKDDKKLKLE